jgi:serine/threonine protein kinase
MVAIVANPGHHLHRTCNERGDSACGGTVTDQDRLIAGRYRLGETAGVGAMGIVWRARDERLRRAVAVKQLLPRPGFDRPLTDYARLRAMREARIAARLQHPNVVAIYDVVEEDGQPWLIMEYVPSRSLALVLREYGPMSPYDVAEIGAQAAAGLAAAHAVGVVHRDVKPGNVLLGDDGIVKITDFGISRSLDDVVKTATGLVTGTPAYLAPEVAKGMLPEPFSDVFALGSTLYAAVEGTPPFGLNENPLALLNSVATGTVFPPANGGPLTPVLMNLLQIRPGDRPTMREAQAELAHIAAQRTILPRRPGVSGASWTRQIPQPVPVPDALDVDIPLEMPLDLDMAFAPASVLSEKPAPPPSDLADDLLAIHDAVLPATMYTPVVRRRHPLRLTTLVVIALLAFGAAVFIVNRAGTGNTPQANGPGGGQVAAPPATTAAPPAPDNQFTFVAMTNLVSRYYGLLPGDVNDAYELLSPQYQAKVAFPEFTAFYGTITQVTPSNFRQIAPTKIVALINFVTQRGAVTHEPYVFTFVSQNGTLIIDDAVQANVAGVKLMSG